MSPNVSFTPCINTDSISLAVLNRLDDLIVFNPLSRKQVRAIVDIRIHEVQKRLATNGRKITLVIDDAAKDWLAAAGYNPAYGARPLNRTIQQEILNPLSRMIIEESIKDGEKAYITADNKANRIVIKPNHEPVKLTEEDDDDFDEMDLDGDATIVSHDSNNSRSN